MGYGTIELAERLGFGNVEGFSLPFAEKEWVTIFIEDFEAADWILGWLDTNLLLLEDFEATDWLLNWLGTNLLLLEDFEAVDWILVWNGTNLLLFENFENGGW
jgi:hypothetical protein